MNGKRKDEFLTNYVLFDLETTGLSKEDEIIEIGAIKVVDGKEIATFEELIKPNNPIPPFATIINGITNDMVKDARNISEVLVDFLAFIEGFSLVGHNISSFDIPFLNRKLKENMYAEIDNDYVDTQNYAKYRINDIEDYKLGTICKYFDINILDAHRAFADCRMNKECYERLAQIEPKGYFNKDAKTGNKKFCIEFCETTIALQTLHVLLLEVIEDRLINEKEVVKLKDWLEKNSDLRGNYPFDRVFNVIEKSLEDNILMKEELEEMLELFTKYTDPVKMETGTLNIKDLAGKLVCLTGEFKYGQKTEVIKLLEMKNATCKDNITTKTNILIVGGHGSASWKCGTYGGKIKKALEMQEKGLPIRIYDEDEVISRCMSEA
ncbi:MAG: exonuclease, polymerase epsilon subunit family [Herbinix sp.]|jgi:DNA polymerase III epsilon subunit family exonuclease|nr:exonuclease, polymerase epsilon subunit family [Herbinix sp.]